MEKNKKIRFKDLNWNLKTVVIFAWITLGYSAFLFLLGFMLGLLGLY